MQVSEGGVKPHTFAIGDTILIPIYVQTVRDAALGVWQGT